MKILAFVHAVGGYTRVCRHARCRRCRWFVCLTLATSALLAIPAWPQQNQVDLSDKSLEDLMNIEVTSVSKKEQTLSTVAAAIFVITQEHIRHSGATNIPDLLRMVPGLDVAQISGDSWAISVRGFNSQFADKLLVLIDGRTVYTPLFAGVYWDVQDVPLEDLERIEVIRGPGATVWGANAVNGVINIITKSSKDTQHALLTGGGGTHEFGFGTAQYGGQINQAATYRLFVKGFDHNSFPSLSGRNGHDELDLLHAGFRIDSTLSKQDTVILQGDLYRGSEGKIADINSFSAPYSSLLDLQTNVSGQNILGRWNHVFSTQSDATLQIYYDRAHRNSIIQSESIPTTDIDFQHRLQRGGQDFVWGVGYRHFSYSTTGSLEVSFNPPLAGFNIFSTFVQDEITLNPNHLYLTVGAKFEHNDFSGFEFQPDVRIAWSLTKNRMLWTSYSRARGTPSPADNALRIGLATFPGPDGLPILLTLQGSRAVVSQNLDAFEAGYRAQASANLSLDLTTFYNKYQSLSTAEPGAPFLELNPSPPHLNIPITFASLMYGETHGIEAAIKWKVNERWTVSPSYAFERIHLHTAPTSQDTQSVLSGQGGSPHHQAQLQSHVILSHGYEWDASAYFVGRLSTQGLPSYTRLDSGLTWRASDHLSISLVGQNLLKDHHIETSNSDQSEKSSLIKRSVYAKLAWQF